MFDALNQGIAEIDAYISGFVGSVYGSVSGMAQGVWNTVRHPIQTYNKVVDATADFMGSQMAARGDTGFWSHARAAWEGAGYLVGSSTGTLALGEAAFGVDLASGEELTGTDRWARGFAGLSGLAFTAVGAVSGYNGALRSFRPGGSGFARIAEFAKGVFESPSQHLFQKVHYRWQIKPGADVGRINRVLRNLYDEFNSWAGEGKWLFKNILDESTGKLTAWGEYLPESRVIQLSAGHTKGTVLEELIHAMQARAYEADFLGRAGRPVRWSRDLRAAVRPGWEREAHRLMKHLGFERVPVGY